MYLVDIVFFKWYLCLRLSYDTVRQWEIKAAETVICMQAHRGQWEQIRTNSQTLAGDIFPASSKIKV